MNFRKQVKRWLYGSCPGFAGAFPYFGTKIHFPIGSWSFTAACEQGIFEAANVQVLQTLVRPGTWMFDVGTNIGLMSVPVLWSVPDAQVVAFEPSPNVLPFLEKTIAGSLHSSRWTLLPKAVGDTTGRINFTLSDQAQSLFDGIRPTHRVPASRTVEVELTTIDTEWTKLGRPNVSVIKIDIEGGELAALRGAQDCINCCSPHILTEWNSQNLSAYDCPPEALLAWAAETRLRIFTVPHFVEVKSKLELRLQMLQTESFLLTSMKETQDSSPV